MILRVIFVALALAAGVAQAQPYRWVDDKGRVHYTDTPPPGAARPEQRRAAGSEAPPSAPATEAQVPFEVQRAQKDFPVTLFSSPGCKEPCTLARDYLNKRGVPFTEAQVWNEETLAKLKERTGAENVPALLVGRSSLTGFETSRYDALLDSAGYPKAGAVPARSQAAPALPEGYEPPAPVEPAKPVVTEPAGKPGPYDSSKLSPPGGGATSRPGPYSAPGDEGAKRP